MVVLWDATFEASPSNAISKSLIDDEIRLTRLGIRERMEVEHNWGFNTDSDTGRHIPGGTSIMDKSTNAPDVQVANPIEGGLYLKQVGANLLIYVYTSGAWAQLSTLDHGGLGGLTDTSAHTQYLLKSGGTLNGNLNMNGKQLRTGASLEFDNLLLHDHWEEAHPTIGTLDSAITDNVITAGKFSTSQSTTGPSALADNTALHIPLSYSRFYFVPQVYVYNATALKFYIIMSYNYGDIGDKLGFSINNQSGVSKDVRVRLEWIN